MQLFTTRGLALAIGLALSLALAGPIWAGHPLSTDDAGTVTPGHLDLEMVFEAIRWDENEEGIGLGLTYGITDTLDFGVGLGYAVVHSTPKVKGMVDPELGFKWRFLDGGEDRPSLAIGGAMTQPCDSALSSGAHDWGGLLIASIPAGESIVHLNLGYTWVGATGEDDVTSWGIALEHPREDGTAWYAEVIGDNSGAPGEDDPLEALVGWSKEYESGAVFSLGLAAGLTKSSPDWRFTMGLTREF